MARPTVDPEGMDLSDDALEAMSEEEQAEAMMAWFDENFEDPANETPHDSEDGFLFVWGGPYDAEEELQDRFGGLVPEEVIHSVAQDLSVRSLEWAPVSSRHDVEPDEDDTLPSDLPPVVVERYRSLVAQHDGWMSEHFLPYVNQEATLAEIQRRLTAAAEAMRALEEIGLPYIGTAPGRGHNSQKMGIVKVGEEPTGPPLQHAAASKMAGELDTAATQVANPAPDATFLGRVRDGVLAAAKAVGLWIAKNLNLAVEEFSKGFGKTLGIAAAGGITLVGIATAFSQFREAAVGLEHIIMQYLPHISP